MLKALSDLRRDYGRGVLLEENIPNQPLELFAGWLQYALDQNIPDANATSLATMDLDGFPTSRIVLLRDATADGLNFYTNYLSAKGHEIELLPRGSLTFFWSAVERQIRVRGYLEKLPAKDSDAYFATRPRSSQLGAWASPQSAVIQDRPSLEHSMAEVTAQFAHETNIPRPPNWGGYRLIPDQFEFWQGRASRLHDRMRAKLHLDKWTWERLAP